MASKIENNRPVDPNARDIQIQTKLIALIGAVIVVSSVLVATVSLTVFDKNQIEATEVQLQHSADGALRVMLDWLLTLKGYAATTANREDVIDAVSENDTDTLEQIISYYGGELDYAYMAFTDTNGTILAAGENGPGAGQNVSSSHAVSKALTGTIGYAYESYNSNYCQVYAYPIKKDGDVVGATLFAYDFTDGDFVSLMKTAYDTECTIFQGDTRIDSSLEGVVGTTLANKTILDLVLNQGGTYKGENKIKGKDYYSVYAPLSNDDGKVTGMLFIAKSLEKIEAIKYTTLKIVVPVAVVLALILMFISFRFIHWLMWRIENVTKQLREMATGEADLTKRVTLRVLDEIGDLVINFNAFCDKLQTIIGETKRSKDELAVSGESMSASTQDTASAITQIIANIDSISHQITTQNQSVQQTAGAALLVKHPFPSVAALLLGACFLSRFVCLVGEGRAWWRQARDGTGLEKGCVELEPLGLWGHQLREAPAKPQAGCAVGTALAVGRGAAGRGVAQIAHVPVLAVDAASRTLTGPS